MKSIANVERLEYEEVIPDAFEGANAGDDGDFTTELACTRSCGKAGLNLG